MPPDDPDGISMLIAVDISLDIFDFIQRRVQSIKSASIEFQLFLCYHEIVKSGRHNNIITQKEADFMRHKRISYYRNGGMGA